MNKALVFAFSVGAAIGSAVTWRLLKKKYERIAHEEVAEMREYYQKKIAEVRDKDISDKEEAKRYAQAMEYIETYGSEALKNTEKGDADEMPDPHVIKPEDFGECLGYDTMFWTYYADGVLADEMDDPVEGDDIVKSVGSGFANHFGDYEPDVVHIRNNFKKTDYEVVKDALRYSDVGERDSHLMVEE